MSIVITLLSLLYFELHTILCYWLLWPPICRLNPALTVPGRSWVGGGVRLNSTVNRQ